LEGLEEWATTIVIAHKGTTAKQCMSRLITIIATEVLNAAK